MKRLLTSVIITLLTVSSGLSDISSSLFQNSFNSSIDAPTDSPEMFEDKRHLVNKTVAIVNSKPITSFELDREVAKLEAMNPNSNFNADSLQLRREALQELISQSVLLQLAERNNIIISNQQLDAAIKDIAAKMEFRLSL